MKKLRDNKPMVKAQYNELKNTLIFKKSFFGQKCNLLKEIEYKCETDAKLH